MIFAIPSRNGEPHNHFSKAEQIMVIDENTRQKTLVDIPETQSHCGRKKVFTDIFRQYQVSAIVIRQIGDSMLKHLFDHQFKVFACPRGKTADELNLSELEEVTEMSYARPSPNKTKHKRCCHQHQGRHDNKLSPVSGQLQSISTIHR
ncbi:NifB/NifX family molybdenum-iron cluster-binding protein [Vibrio quintilis]|uniref:Dinitrogenase iron-molybdenum cofactor n=1 Tax=Vibrio quintilis TaxID=1117707 RepID=A0A1M7YX52_9VIBR|nr:NifB/NifX family molybdenum-iron cluster-binding protein [Vibrio quintilis]SHO57178.1 Dinitrogenase iron-molybdenum cofactor [Vibrio quintilis]